MDGNVPLYAFHFSNPAYWYTATKGNVSLVFNPTTAFMYVISVEDNSTAFNMTRTVPTPISDYYHRATINDKGNFQQLAFYKGNGASQWDVVWEAISQPCTVYVHCTCLPGCSPWDPNIPSKGCYPNVVMDFCAPNSLASDFTIERLDDSDFPNSDFANLAKIEKTNEDGCRKEVMNDCFCVAGVFYRDT